MPSPNPSVQRTARDIKRLQEGVFHATTLPRLRYSSIDGGNVELRDMAGNTMGYIGEQFDGSIGAIALDPTPPAQPSQPLVTPVQGGLTIYWDGTWADSSVTRLDFARVTFHAVTNVDDFDPTSPGQIVGQITTATGGEVTTALPVVEQFVFAVAWSTSGVYSAESDPSFGTPLALTDDADFVAVQEEAAAATAAAANAPAVYRQPEQPVVEAGKKAVWFDTDGGNVPSFFDGTTWTVMPLGQGALAADAVIAETIAATALDGKTITGALVQTSTAVDRGIKLVGDSLVAYDAAGAPTLLVDGADGSITMTGPLVSGGKLTSTTIETHPSANVGIKIVGNVLTAYDGAGNPSLVANGNDGSLTLQGPSIVGGTIKTASSGERVEVGSDPATLSAVQFFSGHAAETIPARMISDAYDSSGSPVGYLKFYGPKFTTSPVGGYDPVLSLGRNSTMSLAGMQADESSMFGNKSIRISTNDIDTSTFVRIDTPKLTLNNGLITFVGEIRMWYSASTTPPEGWLICNGTTFPGTTYPKLQAFLGSTTLPDFRGRSPMGIGQASSGSMGNVYSLGQKYGHEDIGQHDHGSTYGRDTSHVHNYPSYGYTNQFGWTNPGGLYPFPILQGANGPWGGSAETADHAHLTRPAGTGNARNVHPILGVNFIIRAV